MKKALLVIDYTCDFVAEDGALTCGLPGLQLEDYIAKTTEEFLNNGDYVFMLNDIHRENDPFHPETALFSPHNNDIHRENDPFHPETALFSPHNIEGTSGRQMFGQLQEIYAMNKDRILWLDKTRYSAFAGTPLDMELRARHIKEIHLMGVCTDICILHTAIDAYNLGYDIFIHTGGVASFNMDAHNFALKHLKNVLNATIIDS